MASKPFVPVLVAMMLLTGVCNTLLTKYQVGVFFCPFISPNTEKTDR